MVVLRRLRCPHTGPVNWPSTQLLAPLLHMARHSTAQHARHNAVRWECLLVVLVP